MAVFELGNAKKLRLLQNVSIVSSNNDMVLELLNW